MHSDRRQTGQQKQQQCKKHMGHHNVAKAPEIQHGSLLSVGTPGVLLKKEPRFTLPLKVKGRKVHYELSDGWI